MNNHMNSGTTDLSTNAYSLLFPDPFLYYGIADTVSEKFLQYAVLLSKGSYLGCQMTLGKKHSSCIVFSDQESHVTASDFDWIFFTCAKTADPLSVSFADLFTEERKVYMLSLVAGTSRDISDSSLRDDHYWGGNIHPIMSSVFIREFYDALATSGAKIQVIVCAPGEDGGHGAVLISLQDSITLKLRSMLSMIFPHTSADEIDCIPSDFLQMRTLPDECISLGLSRLLRITAYPDSKTDSMSPDYEDDEDYDIDYVDEDETDLSGDETGTSEEPPEDPVNYMSKLDELIGLDEVKDHIRKIAAFAKMKQDMKNNGIHSLPLVLNMSFAGNPGTAKTTAARIIAGILYEIGILSSAEPVEVGRADLVAEYVGQTAIKVKKVFQEALGKLLFIDEAYSLLDGHSNSYGDEAINTIVQEMENHRDDTVVIFAGYPNQMKDFFTRNPGLRSRVPFHIHFKDYSADELIQIVELETHKRGFTISPDARNKAGAICRSITGNPKAGNGRFCRNLTENAILLYASRVYGTDSAENPVKNDFILLPEDFNYISAEEPEKPKFAQQKTIGFLAS